MADKVVSLSGAPVPVAEGREMPRFLTLLNDAIVRVRRGEIANLAIIYTDDAGNAGGTYDGKAASLLFAMARLERRIHQKVDDEMEG